MSSLSCIWLFNLFLDYAIYSLMAPNFLWQTQAVNEPSQNIPKKETLIGQGVATKDQSQIYQFLTLSECNITLCFSYMYCSWFLEKGDLFSIYLYSRRGYPYLAWGWWLCFKEVNQGRLSIWTSSSCPNAPDQPRSLAFIMPNATLSCMTWNLNNQRRRRRMILKS